MKKQIQNDSVLYTIAWSQTYKYDKYLVRKILPGLPGIISIFTKNGSRIENLVFIACWRDGCRQCITRLFNPEISKQLHLYENLKDLDMHYQYTIVDSSPKDMQDILHWLINNYDTKYNDPKSYNSSNRFSTIAVDEKQMGKDDVVEKIYKTYQ